MKAKELRDLTYEELVKKESDLQEELFNLRFRFATGQLDNPMTIKVVRRDMARVKTVIRQKEMEKAESVLRFLRRTIDHYKSYELPLAYYREFNPRSVYRTLDGEEYMEFWDDRKEQLDLSYNYFIFCNLAKILL